MQLSNFHNAIIVFLSITTTPVIGKVSPTVASGNIQRTNKYRTSSGLDPLQQNSKLQKTAQQFAVFMAKTGKYGHTADGRKASQRAALKGYQYCIIKENIAKRFRRSGFTNQELIAGFSTDWWESPGHKQNILDSDATEMGVGFSQADNGYYYGVQLLGRPKSQERIYKFRNDLKSTVEYLFGDQLVTIKPGSTKIHQRCRPLNFQCKCNQKKPFSFKPRSGVLYSIHRRTNGIVVEESQKDP